MNQQEHKPLFSYEILDGGNPKLITAYETAAGTYVTVKEGEIPQPISLNPSELENHWLKSKGGRRINNYQITTLGKVIYLYKKPAINVVTLKAISNTPMQFGLYFKAATLAKDQLLSIYSQANGFAAVSIENQGMVQVCEDMPIELLKKINAAAQIIEVKTHYVDPQGQIHTTTANTSSTKHPCTCNSHILFLRGCQCGGI